MSIISDLRTALRLVERLLTSRRSRRQLAQRLPSAPKPTPGSVEIAVYFADGPVNMYQVRQWYAPLAELAKTHPVAIVSRSPGTMLTLLDESPEVARGIIRTLLSYVRNKQMDQARAK
jgi:hypothetical protein